MWDEFLKVLDDPELWKGVAFFLSIALIVLPVYQLLITMVRKRSHQIAERLEEALKLRREAEALLRETQRKDFHKDEERKRIMQGALKDARTLKDDAAKELDKRLLEKKYEILDRVRLIRQTGLQELREKVVSVAVDTTEQILKDDDRKTDNQAFMQVGLEELEWVLKQEENVERLKKALTNN